MIPAPFVAGCPAAIDRAVWFLLSSSALDETTRLTPSVAQLLFVVPAAIVTLVAAWAWRTRNTNAAVGVALVAAAVHPPLILALAPLLAGARVAQRFGRLDAIRFGVLTVGLAVLLLGVAPACVPRRDDDLFAFGRETLRVLRASAGVIAAILALFETVRSPRETINRTAWSVIVCSLAAVLVFQSFDARLTLVPAAIALWVLAVRAARTLVVSHASVPGRVAAATLLALVPVLHVATASAGSDRPTAPLTVRETAAVLNRMQRPATITSESAGLDLVLRWWRAGNRNRARPVRVIDAADSRARELLQAGPLYAFDASARRFQDHGILMAPVDAAAPGPVLWRALATTDCVALTTLWQDITPLARAGQLSGVFAEGATGRHAVIYATFPRASSVSGIDWPPLALAGLRVATFMLADGDRRKAFHYSALADDFPITNVGPDEAAVGRVILERLQPTPGALAIAFESIPNRVFARLDTGPIRDALELCGSTRDLAVAGYPEAPAVIALDLRSAAVAGSGWDAPERDGDVRFRWMAAREAELRFVSVAAVELFLELDVLDRAGGGTREPEGVMLNGAAATCLRVSGSCRWWLRSDSLIAGVNILTIRSSAPLKIAGARLHAPAVSRMR